MYEKAKKAFIKEYAKGNYDKEKECSRLFGTFDSLEDTLNKDLSAMSKEEIMPTLEGKLKITKSSSWNILRLLIKYTKWCVKNKVDGAYEKDLALDKDDAVKGMRLRSISDPRGMKEYLDKVFSLEEEEDVQLSYRCALWLVYFGVDANDVPTIRERDVDLDEMSILYREKKMSVPIYNAAYRTIWYCSTHDTFNYYHPNYGTKKRPRAEGDALARGFRDINMRSLMGRRKTLPEEKRKFWLTLYEISMSGYFYKTYIEKDKLGIDLNFSFFAKEELRKKGISESNGSYKRVLARKVEEIEKAYEVWKLAWNKTE